MPLAAPIAASLNFGLPTRSFALWVGGVDMLKQPGVSGNRFGIPLDSIEVVENGPGGVSSLRCSIEDPLLALSLPPAGSEVLFMDLADDHPEFLGFIQKLDVRPHEGQQGRWLDLEAIGIECLLDWSIVQLLPLTPLTLSQDAFQSAAAISASNLRAFKTAASGQGNQAFPIGAFVAPFLLDTYTIAAVTLREAIKTIWNQIDPAFTDQIAVTVDFYRGLRIWAVASSYLTGPSDYATLTVDDTAHTNGSAALHYTLTPADVVRAVYVLGGGGYAGTFTDGSGIVGPMAVLNDATILNATDGFRAAQQYLGQFAATLRANLHLETFNHGATNYHPGSPVLLTNTTLELSGIRFFISSISKRYNANGSEEWDVAFGGLAPSAMNSLRRLTRDTLS